MCKEASESIELRVVKKKEKLFENFHYINTGYYYISVKIMTYGNKNKYCRVKRNKNMDDIS